MIHRNLRESLIRLSHQFPVVALMGPRQSGKTTLSKESFPDYAYVSLEDLDSRALAKEDPRYFLSSFDPQKGVIIDEIQMVPELFSYLQGVVDQKNRPGFFIITGSQNFLLYEKISQTLAGRVALLTLLPLSLDEFFKSKLLPSNLDEFLIKGSYPRLYAQNIDYGTWFSNYIATYIEKDVRQVLKINDIVTFQRFVKMCAARVGSILNYADIARDCDISLNTAKSWISILESSYIIKLVYPYYKNFNKRVIKSPKIYFYDTGIICALLGIKNAEELKISPMRGHIFESFVMSEFFKYYFNHNQPPAIYFWRDIKGHEIDCIIEIMYDVTAPIEIKSRMTISNDFFKALKEWEAIVEKKSSSYVVYAGEDNHLTSNGQIFSWRSLPLLFEELLSFNKTKD